MKPDSGASGIYIREQDQQILQNMMPSTNHQVMLPDGTTIQSTNQGRLPIPELSPTAATAHVFKDLHSASLLSVGQLCDDNCLVLFDKQHVRIFKNNQEILKGDRNHRDKLWDINITKKPTHTANVIIKKEKTTSELIQYFQGCCFSPTKATFLKAVKNGNFITWPGLTPSAVQQYYK